MKTTDADGYDLLLALAMTDAEFVVVPRDAVAGLPAEYDEYFEKFNDFMAGYDVTFEKVKRKREISFFPTGMVKINHCGLSKIF